MKVRRKREKRSEPGHTWIEVCIASSVKRALVSNSKSPWSSFCSCVVFLRRVVGS